MTKVEQAVLRRVQSILIGENTPSVEDISFANTLIEALLIPPAIDQQTKKE